MKVAHVHQIDIEHGSSLHHDADDFVFLGMISGSALHGLAETAAQDARLGVSEVSADVFRAVDRVAVHRRLVGARLPRPVHLETVEHPEVERDLVLKLRPQSVTTATVRFLHVGRPAPRIVLDVIIDDE